ncbi:MAG: CBS domain-containing protein [Allobranchiibius sp.]
MSSPVITVLAGATRTLVADLLTGHRIGAVPVIDDAGAVVGLVSEHDLLAKSEGTAAELMTTALITVSPDCPVNDLRHLLVERRVRRVPVMRDGRLVGIVSRGDIVATMATEWACQVCGECARGDSPPDRCPKCHAAGEQFVLQEQLPGA